MGHSQSLSPVDVAMWSEIITRVEALWGYPMQGSLEGDVCIALGHAVPVVRDPNNCTATALGRYEAVLCRLSVRA